MGILDRRLKELKSNIDISNNGDESPVSLRERLHIEENILDKSKEPITIDELAEKVKLHKKYKSITIEEVREYVMYDVIGFKHILCHPNLIIGIWSKVWQVTKIKKKKNRWT